METIKALDRYIATHIDVACAGIIAITSLAMWLYFLYRMVKLKESE